VKVLNWRVVLGFVLLLLSVAFYFLHYILVHDLRGLLAVIAVGVTIHLLVLKTLTREMLKELVEATVGKSMAAQALNDTQPT